MISMSELLHGTDLNSIPQEHQNNLESLLKMINQVRLAYGAPMTVSSGYRSMEDHLRIYREKAEHAGTPFDESKVPMHSKHLSGLAVDIADHDKKLQAWCKLNEAFLDSVGVWMENFEYTKSPSAWCHFQCVQYGSWEPGKSLWFIP